MTFEIRISDVMDTPPRFLGSFESAVNEDVPIVSRWLGCVCLFNNTVLYILQ